MRGEIGAEGSELGRRRQVAVPEQPRRLLERRVRGELADGESGDDQLARLAIDVTETRRRRDDVFETAGDFGVGRHEIKLAANSCRELPKRVVRMTGQTLRTIGHEPRERSRRCTIASTFMT